MRLPEWCATHSFKEFLELMEENLDPKGSKKGKKMNAQINAHTAQEPVVAIEGTPEFLKRVADKLAKDGEVLVQTEADRGAEATPTLN